MNEILGINNFNLRCYLNMINMALSTLCLLVCQPQNLAKTPKRHVNVLYNIEMTILLGYIYFAKGRSDNSIHGRSSKTQSNSVPLQMV